MIDVITQETIRTIIPSKVALALEEIAKREHADPFNELPAFYASKTYRALETEKSKYWWFSPHELAGLYLAESAQASQHSSY